MKEILKSETFINVSAYLHIKKSTRAIKIKIPIHPPFGIKKKKKKSLFIIFILYFTT